MMLDRKVDVTTALVTSLWAARENPLVMLVWACINVALVGIKYLTAFVGLLVFSPCWGTPHGGRIGIWLSLETDAPVEQRQVRGGGYNGTDHRPCLPFAFCYITGLSGNRGAERISKSSHTYREHLCNVCHSVDI